MKKRKDQLKEKSSTLFLMGLTCAMAFSLVSFEWKDFESRDYYLGFYDEEDMAEDPFVYVIPEPKPKKAKKAVVKTKVSLEKQIIDDDVNLVDKKEQFFDPIKYIHEIDEADSVEVDEGIVELPYEAPDQKAEFPGGLKEMYRYLSTMNYPPDAVEVGISGQVYLQFIVRKDGEIDNIKVLRGIGGGCDEEAVKILNKSPLWKPGFVKGVAVDSYFNLPVEFSLK